MWKKELDHAITILPDGGPRVQCIQVATDTGLVSIINTYMPSEGTHDQTADYHSVLDEVNEITQKLKVNSKVIWLGDLNGSFIRAKQTSNDKALKAFCVETGYHSKLSSRETPTYHHFSGQATSQIDHIMGISEQDDLINEVIVDVHNPHNVSSHDAVVATLGCTPIKCTAAKSSCQVPSKQKPNWKKADPAKYLDLTEQRLECLIEAGGLDLPAEALVDRINDILLQCASECGAHTPKPRCKRSTKMPWNNTLKPLVKALKQSLWAWKSAGKPLESPEHTAVKDAKRSLRSAQRQLAAMHRKEHFNNIMTAHSSDKQTFYKIIKKQRNTKRSDLAIIDFEDSNASEEEKWSEYFEQLATPKDNPHYNTEYKNSRELQFMLLQLLEDREGANKHEAQLTEEVIGKHIASLKNGKAADMFGITAEHLKLASPTINTVLQALTGKIFTNQKLPGQFKTGVITPVLKKGKPAKDPNSYRRITVNSIVGKVVEREMATQTKALLADQHSNMQFGFTEGSSSSNCCLIITEAIAEARDRSIPLHITFLDAKKAFDVVWHHSALASLREHGIKGPLWNLYSDMYETVTSRIKVNGTLTREIHETQGIRQGGLTSTEIFNNRNDDILKKINTLPEAFHIGSIPVGDPTCADDMTLLAPSAVAAQTILNVAQDEANRERYEFSATKTKAMLCNSNLPVPEAESLMPIQLNGTPLQYTSQETHLGQERAINGKPTATVAARIQTGRRTAYALMGAGLHGLNGVSPEVSVHMVNIYVLPTISHGLETLHLPEQDYQSLEKHHKTLLRCLQHLPTATATQAIYLLTGSIPFRALHHKRILTFFCSVLRRDGSVEQAIVERQMAMKTLDSHSWTALVRKLLHFYNLPNAFILARNPPNKEAWKRKVNNAVHRKCYLTLREEAAEKKTLKYLNTDACVPGEVHPVWKCGTDPHQVTMATIKALLLVQRYPLHGTHSAGKSRQEDCPLCRGPAETLEHFLLQCPCLQEARQPYRQKIDSLLEEFFYQPQDDSDRIQAILDPSVIVWAPSEVQEEIEELSRRMCYSLHVTRGKILGTRFSKNGVTETRSNHSSEIITRGSPTPREAVDTSE